MLVDDGFLVKHSNFSHSDRLLWILMSNLRNATACVLPTSCPNNTPGPPLHCWHGALPKLYPLYLVCVCNQVCNNSSRMFTLCSVPGYAVHQTVGGSDCEKRLRADPVIRALWCRAAVHSCISSLIRRSSLELLTINRQSCTITEKAPTRAFSWLKAAATAFTFKTLC